MRHSGKKILAGIMLCLLAGIAKGSVARDSDANHPEAEFQMLRMKYRTFGGGGSHGYYQPWWAIDYPVAEEHFFPALRRTTNVQVAEDERHLELMGARLYEYPFLLL